MSRHMEKHDKTLKSQYGFCREKSFLRSPKFSKEPASLYLKATQWMQIFQFKKKTTLTMSLIQKALKTTKLARDVEESPPEDS